MRYKSFFSLWLAIPVLTTLNQACIKLLAEKMNETSFGFAWLLEVIKTPWAIGILICEVLSFALWLTILSDTDISKATPVTAISYFAILLMSWVLFNEPVQLLQIIGSALILSGVWLIGSAASKK